MIEGVILGVKYFKKNDGEKENLEYRAAILITSAASIELTAISIQSVTARYAPTGVVGRGAAVTLGGLRIFGGTLAAVGGAMLAVIDYEDSNKYYEKKYSLLGHAYIARSVVSVGIAGLAAVASMPYSGPLLRFLFGANSRFGLILLVDGLARLGLVPVILRWIGRGSLVTFGLSVAIAYLSPNPMEEWTWHSCLKKWENGSFIKPFKNKKTELTKLYEALQAVN